MTGRELLEALQACPTDVLDLDVEAGPENGEDGRSRYVVGIAVNEYTEHRELEIRYQ